MAGLRRVLACCAGCSHADLADLRSWRPMLQVNVGWMTSICRTLLGRVLPAWQCATCQAHLCVSGIGSVSTRHGLCQCTSPAGLTQRTWTPHALEDSFWQATVSSSHQMPQLPARAASQRPCGHRRPQSAARPVPGSPPQLCLPTPWAPWPHSLRGSPSGVQQPEAFPGLQVASVSD